MMSPDEALETLKYMKVHMSRSLEYGSNYWTDDDELEALEVAIAALEEKCHE